MTADEPMSTPDSGGRIPHDDRLITCPECRSTFEAEDGSVVHMLVAPDSADDATVGERGGCTFGCTTHACRFPCDAGADPSDDVWNPRTRHWYCPLGNDNCGAHDPATPPADDANRAPVSGGLDEGDVFALAKVLSGATPEFADRAAEGHMTQARRLLASDWLAARDAAWVERLAAVEGERDRYKDGWRVAFNAGVFQQDRAEAAEAERDTARREAGERIAVAMADEFADRVEWEDGKQYIAVADAQLIARNEPNL